SRAGASGPARCGMSVQYLPATGHEPCATHPEKWEALPGSPDLAEARRLCKTACPITADCLEYALRKYDTAPVMYGGNTGEERRQILLARRRDFRSEEHTSELQS